MGKKNNNLNAAKSAKNDEFYTSLSSVENELRHYKEHFKNKVILCNCNDAAHTGFAIYFALQFDVLGLKEVICTAYNPNGHGFVYRYHGEKKGDYIPPVEGWDKTQLEGDGGFSSAEGLSLIDEADIIATNPPFSLFRDFITILLERDKKFIIIGNMNGITYNEVFPSIRDGKLWLGTQYVKEFMSDSGETKRFGNILWYTNLDYKKRHEPLILYKNYNEEEYPHYDNYDGIEVSKTCEIPMDYKGVMGVPVSFLDKWCPDQFEIVDRLNAPVVKGNKIYKRLMIKLK